MLLNCVAFGRVLILGIAASRMNSHLNSWSSYPRETGFARIAKEEEGQSVGPWEGVVCRRFLPRMVWGPFQSWTGRGKGLVLVPRVLGGKARSGSEASDAGCEETGAPAFSSLSQDQKETARERLSASLGLAGLELRTDAPVD